MVNARKFRPTPPTREQKRSCMYLIIIIDWQNAERVQLQGKNSIKKHQIWRSTFRHKSNTMSSSFLAAAFFGSIFWSANRSLAAESNWNNACESQIVHNTITRAISLATTSASGWSKKGIQRTLTNQMTILLPLSQSGLKPTQDETRYVRLFPRFFLSFTNQNFTSVFENWKIETISNSFLLSKRLLAVSRH